LLAKVATSMKLRSKLNALTSSKTVKAKSIYNIILKMFNK